MINRREVIASALAVSLLARTAAGKPAVVGAEGQLCAAPLFVADERFPEARAAAGAASMQGAAVRTLSRDITALYELLDRTWTESPIAAAGLTTEHSLFVIERLAWDRGLRTVYRGVHRRGADGRMEHEPFGSPALTSRLSARGNGGWAEAVGRVLVESASVSGERRQTVSLQPLPGPGRATLASWLLVPKSAAGGSL